MTVVSHHSTGHPAEVNRVNSLNVVFAFVIEMLRADLQELQTRFKDPRLILCRGEHKCSCTDLQTRHSLDPFPPACMRQTGASVTECLWIDLWLLQDSFSLPLLGPTHLGFGLV